MITPNSDFKKALSENKTFVNYADLVLRDGTQIELTPKDFIIGAFSLKDETTSGKFGVGYAIGKTISLTLANHDERFSAYDFYKAIIHMYVAVELEDGRVLKERKGKYYVMNPTTPGEVIGLSGVDSMYLFDKPYNAPTAYPATLQSIISDCCVACGVRVSFGQFPNYNFIVEQYPEDVTCREVISYAAQLAGMNARINNDDALDLVWYDENLMEMLYSNNNIDGGNLFDYNTGSEQDGGNFIDYSSGVALDGGYFTDPAPENVRKVKSLKISTDDVIISGVRVIGEDNTAFLGTDDYVIEVKNNPLVNGKEYQVCEYLYSRLSGLKFRPLTCETTHNPLYEPFDVMIVYDRKGNGYPTLINSVSYKTGGFTTLSCKADDPVRNESSYNSEAAKAVVQAKRNAEKQLSTYDLAVQEMNELAANAMGIFRESETLEDNSVIYYMSNRPITKNEDGKCEFALQSVVYKMTGDGFFVSNDGGLSFTSGFDSEGNAVVNVLSAIGITFDWARGGTLSLGGFDNKNGVINIFNSDGTQVGTIDNSGIAFYSPTTQLQVIISPDVGIVQRDSDGNEYNGLIKDETIYLPAVDENNILYREAYVGLDSDTLLNSVYETKTEGYLTYYRTKYYYVHTSAYWGKTVVYYQGSTSYRLKLPESFRGKRWIIRIINDGIDSEKRENTDYYYTYDYNMNNAYCDEDNYVVTDWFLYSPPLPADAQQYITQLNSMPGKPTPYLELPSPSSDTLEFKNKYELSEITDYSLSYEIDEENNEIIITGYAKCGSYYINDLMKVRVIAVC